MPIYSHSYCPSPTTSGEFGIDTQPDIAEPAALTPHTDLFRRETSLLRGLFGLAEGDVSTVVNQLGDVEFGEGLSSTAIKDVVFAAIDINTSRPLTAMVPGLQLHIGVSILST